MAPRRLRLFCCFFIAIVSHSLIFTVLRQQGACNQGEKCFRSVLRQFTRRHSFCSSWRDRQQKKQAYPVATGNLLGKPPKTPINPVK